MGEIVTWSGLHGTADTLAIAELAQAHDGLVLVITRDSASAQRWQGSMEFFQAGQVAPLQFPDWETLPYDAFSPHQDIVSERLATLTHLPNRTDGVLTVPVTTLMQRIAPAQYLAGASFDFCLGQKLDVQAQRLT
jgi:transcription-repair coupling factor (superfamily II helicase)